MKYSSVINSTISSKLLIGIVFFTIMLSCHKEKEKMVVEIPLWSTLSEQKTIHLNDIGSELKLVPLETTEESLIQNISNVILLDKGVIVIHEKVCSLFDYSGKFIRNIGRSGEGPEEYLGYPQAFADNNNLLIYDDSKKQILYYTLDGTFVKTVKLPKDVTSVMSI